MISIEEREKEEKIKEFDLLNTNLWGMANILRYYVDSLNPDEKYNLMQALEEKKSSKELKSFIFPLQPPVTFWSRIRPPLNCISHRD